MAKKKKAKQAKQVTISKSEPEAWAPKPIVEAPDVAIEPIIEEVPDVVIEILIEEVPLEPITPEDPIDSLTEIPVVSAPFNPMTCTPDELAQHKQDEMSNTLS